MERSLIGIVIQWSFRPWNDHISECYSNETIENGTIIDPNSNQMEL